MISIKGENYKVVANMQTVRCVIHDLEERTVKILYTDNTKSQFKDVIVAKIGGKTAWGDDEI